MKRLKLAALLALLSICSAVLLWTLPATATVTNYISFQGKLTNTDGTNVTNNSYTIVFSIYTVSSGGTAVWSESKSVTVTDGLFQTNLGDATTLPGSVNFNSNSLYLGIKVGTDAEMTPRVQLTAAPQAINSDYLDGLDSSNFVQLSGGNVNIGSGTITSGAVNGLTLTQAADGFTIAGGTTSRTLTVNGANITVGSTIQPTAAGSLIVQSNGANALTLTSGAAATWSTTAGQLTVQGFGGVAINTPGASGATSAITIQTGNSSAGTAGSITIDTGTTATGTPTVNIANANAKALQIGNNTSNPSITIDSGTGTISLGTGAQGRTINLGTGAAAQLVTVGSASGASSLDLQAGTGGIDITTQGTGPLNIGNNAVAQTINIGNATGATALTLQSGTGGLFVKPITANTAAFTVQDSGGAKYLVADTSNVRLYVGDPAGVSGNPALLVLASRSTTGDPTNGVNGSMYYNSANNKFRCYEAGAWVSCANGGRKSATAVSTVSNTTTETAFSTNYTIPANDCQPGRVYRVTARGVYGTTTTGPALTVRVKMGTTVIGSNATTTTTASLTNQAWNLSYDITCITAGSTGTVEGQGQLNLFTSTSAVSSRSMVNTATVTINTTTAQTLQVSAQFGTANAANTITARELVIEALGP